MLCVVVPHLTSIQIIYRMSCSFGRKHIKVIGNATVLILLANDGILFKDFIQPWQWCDTNKGPSSNLTDFFKVAFFKV